MRATSDQRGFRQLLCRSFSRAVWIGGLLCSVALASEPEFNREQLEFFEKQIRPVLAAQCWNCHSESKQESGLRLDSRAAILKGGDRGASVKSGQGATSLLVHAIQGSGDLKMPPNGRLSSEQTQAFSHWIDLGLPWPIESAASARQKAWQLHWAFLPLTDSPIPAMTDDQWSDTPIDRFILQRLKASSTSPAVSADRRILIRRLSFDLIGLPPTPEEVDECLSDTSPDALERFVDRLLASPRYGERWARHWLDLARYADNKGYVFFEEPSYPWAYTYRDYVIRAFNEDLPYDQFVLEQLAADQLDRGENNRSLAAMGYLTVGGHFMGNVHDIIDDRIDVVSRGLLGLTVSCARCHDHKYDPIPTTDYYALYGVFRSTTEPLVPPLLSTPPDSDAYRKFTIELSLRQQKLDDFIQMKHSQLVEGARTRVAEYLMAARAATENPATDDFMLIADPGDLNPAMIVRWQSYLEKLAGTSRTDSAAGSSSDTAAGNELRSHSIWAPWLILSREPDAKFAAKAATYWKEFDRPDSVAANKLIVESIRGQTSPGTIGDLANRYGELMKSIHQEWQGAIKEAVILKRPIPTVFDHPDKEAIRQELYGEQAPASVPQVFGWGFLSLLPDRSSQAEYQKVLKEVEQWIINGPGAPPRAMVLTDGALYQPRVFQRGNPSRPGEPVSRRYLTAFSDGQEFTHGSGRLDLARKIVDPQNPLTYRVLINRLWQWHFGSGLVRSPGDFGMRSDPPTHPELLDWMARELTVDRHPIVASSAEVDQSATARSSLKRIHRLIVNSQVYQQSSIETADSKDPENRLWHRSNRQRLDFEATRDALIFVTGQLQDRIGGPSQNLLDGFQPRRTLYLFLNRLDLPNLLSVFDFPSPAATSSQRETTTISPQALFLLNGPLTAAVADAVQSRPEMESISTIDDRVIQLYRTLFQRMPKEEERKLAREFLGTQPSAAQWSQLTHALLVTNEFVFID